MDKVIINRLLAVLLGVAISAGILLFLRVDGGRGFELRIAGEDGRPAPGSNPDAGPVKVEGVLTKGDGVASEIKGTGGRWPWFRGQNFRNITQNDVELIEDWSGGLQTLWSVDVGEGYAGPAILNGMVYLIDYDQKKREDAIRCLSLDDGKEIWRYSYPVKVSRNHGMSRTVPAVTDEYVVTIGPKCHVTCLDAKSGEFKWMLNLVAEFGTKVPLWYAGQCPFIDDGKVILAPGGTAMMMAVDCETGEIAWQTPNPNKWVMTHTSIVPMEFAGRKMYVWVGGGKYDGGIVGVDAADGKVLWVNNDWKMRTNVPSPVVIDDGKIFVSAGYDEGSMMIQLLESDGKFNAERLYRLKPKIFGSEQHTPIYYKGYIYGVRPDWQLVCMDVDGNIVWTSTSAKEFYRLGPWAVVNGMIYVMDGEGRLTLVKATHTGYQEIAETNVIEGHESWGPMAVADGRLIVRNLKKMACIKIGE
jgi:outer membrane protein assembly factor BamB